ncbi:FbpB family small basic protein [Lentibacillus sp. CBA3610]|nr:FbpB family small basic protein [Lentibacillus sp. CBA3610]QKY71427.1 FbpB family small basic protein [Lentibacillus sp. CBA3610]
MKTKSLTFEQLVQENKQELLADEKQLSQIEKRLEKKQTGLLRDKQKT